MIPKWKESIYLSFILLHFIQFKKRCFYRASPVAASGHWHCFPSLLFSTFSVSSFRSSHRKRSIKKAVLKVLQYLQETPILESFLNKVQGWRPATLLKRDSNTGVFMWIFLFTNSYRVTCVFLSVLTFLVDDYKKQKQTITKKKKNVTPTKTIRAKHCCTKGCPPFL